MPTPVVQATLVYFANPTGPRTAAALAATMATAAAGAYPASKLAAMGTSITSIVGDVFATRARLTVVLNTSSAAFLTRFPSVINSGLGPFGEPLTAVLRAAIDQPVLASTPTFLHA